VFRTQCPSATEVIVQYFSTIGDRTAAHRKSERRRDDLCAGGFRKSGQIIFVADAHRDDGRRFIVHADEKLSAFVELEREVLTVTFYLESIRDGDQ
jgi:hypothetical protein